MTNQKAPTSALDSSHPSRAQHHGPRIRTHRHERAHRRDIDARTARTIAAQLQRGPGSALYAFAVSGTISDRLYEELDEVVLGRSPTVKRWVDALAGYCVGLEA